MTSVPTEEEVLDAFAVEPSHDDETIQRYLLAYPQYAESLVDLSRELSRELREDAPLSDREVAWIDEAVKRYAGSPSFTPPTVDQCRAAAKELRVPRQVVTAILECKVVVDTISQRARKVLAAQFEATLEGLIEAISGPQTSVSRSYKADDSPYVGEKVSLERVLRDAGVAEDVIADLVAKED
jgi:hypothetical protein